VSRPADAVIQRVDEALAAFLDERAASLSMVGPELSTLSRAARVLIVDGGKRLRPSFAYWGWRSVRSEQDDDSALISAAAALELLHGCALVHDDVMDASATRRGHPSAHRAFAQLHRSSEYVGDAEAFGAAAAILLGDLLLSWADNVFAAAPIDRAARQATREVWDGMRQLVMAGQYLDVLVQAKGGFDAAEALRVAELKTGKYTIEGPLHLGAAAAGGDAATRAALSRYGIPLGEAFQLRDDVLGVFGDPELTGKPAGDDLREGKRTLLVALAMGAADRAQAELLRAHLGDRSLGEDDVERLRAIIVDTGALGQVERRIAERAAAARDALDADLIAAEARDALAGLAVAASERHS
jgi:geranylgeranyl diphosphate synthase type I